MNWRDQTLQSLIRDPITGDSRSTNGSLLGYSTNDVFNKVINFGQANFDQPYEELTGNDRARLYALLNQPGHLSELDTAFAQMFSLHSGVHDPFVFDIGCGPFTAGLSLAAALGQEQVLRYYGIDIYQSMRELGQEIALSAKKLNGLNKYSEFSFHESLDSILPPLGVRNNPKLFIASYLLASSTIQVGPLVNAINNIADNFTRGPSLLLYSNTTHPLAGKKYPEFKQHLKAAGFQCPADDNMNVTHKNRLRPVHFALFYKPASY